MESEEDSRKRKPTRRLISELSSETDDDSDLDGYCLFWLGICIRKKLTLITRSKNYSSKTRNIFCNTWYFYIYFHSLRRGVVTLLTCTWILFLQSFLCVCSVKFNIFFLNIPLLVWWNMFLVFYITRGITSPPKIKFSLTQRTFMLSVVISILTKPVGKSLVLSRQLRKFSVAPRQVCRKKLILQAWSSNGKFSICDNRQKTYHTNREWSSSVWPHPTVMWKLTLGVRVYFYIYIYINI